MVLLLFFACEWFFSGRTIFTAVMLRQTLQCSSTVYSILYALQLYYAILLGCRSPLGTHRCTGRCVHYVTLFDRSETVVMLLVVALACILDIISTNDNMITITITNSGRCLFRIEPVVRGGDRATAS